MAKAKADPTYSGAEAPGPAYERMRRASKWSRLLMQGQAALRAAGDDALPRWVGQTEQLSETAFQWQRRLKIATLHNLYKRTILDLVHQVYSRRLSINPAGMPWAEAMMKNIDGEKTHHDSMLRGVSKDSMAECISHVLVDAPPPTDAPNAQTAGPRYPFWVHFPACEIIDVESVTVGGEKRVGLVRRKYQRQERVNAIRREPVDIIQVLERGDPSGQGDDVYASSMRLRPQRNSKGDQIGWMIEPGSERVFKPTALAPAEIHAMFIDVPIVPFYTSKVGFFEGDLLLDTLCDLQMTHFRETNEKDNAKSIAGIAMKLFSGFTEKQMTAVAWGPMTVIAHPDTTADVKDISFASAPLEFMAKDLQDLERKMAIAALEPSVSRATGEEKSTIRLLDEAKRLTLIQAIALEWMDAASQCWVWSAAYQGIDGRNISVEIKEEVFEALGQSASFSDFLSLWKAERPEHPILSDQTAIKEAQRYGALSDRVKPEEELRQTVAEAALRAVRETAAPTIEPKAPVEDLAGVPS